MINVSTQLISTDLFKLKKKPSAVKWYKHEKRREKKQKQAHKPLVRAHEKGWSSNVA